MLMDEISKDSFIIHSLMLLVDIMPRFHLYPRIQLAIRFVIAAIIVVRVVGLLTGKRGWTFVGFVVTWTVLLPFCKRKIKITFLENYFFNDSKIFF